MHRSGVLRVTRGAVMARQRSVGSRNVRAVVGRGLIAGSCMAAVGIGAVAGPVRADNAPSVTVQLANVSPTAATANVTVGSVDPRSTGMHFDLGYAPSSGTWCVNTTAGVFSNSAPHSETPQQPYPTGGEQTTIGVTALTAGQEYCVIGLAYVTSTSVEPASPRAWYFTAGAPNVTPGNGSAASATSETVSATIDPVGGATTYVVEWGRASPSGAGGAPAEQWCDSGGTQGTPAQTTAATALSSSTSPQSVSYTITGLDIGTSYCWAFRATNASGTSTAFPTHELDYYGATDVFTLSAPTVQTGAATQITAHSATLDLTYNDSGALSPTVDLAYASAGMSLHSAR